MSDTPNALIPLDAPDMAPLRNSHEANQAEADLKAIFLTMVASYIRASERNINTLGMPHLGGQDQFERSLKQDGLALVRTVDQEAMRYVFKAWKARNPKRGLHMLKLYLQMLWPNSWECDQMWQDKALPYPTGLAPADGGNHFLTSRVNVKISSSSSDGSDLATVAPALRSVIPARVLLNLAIEQTAATEMGMAAGAYGLVFQQFTTNLQ
jgi:hypothetical protein